MKILPGEKGLRFLFLLFRVLPDAEQVVVVGFLAENSGWEEQALDEAAHIISRYTTGYLHDIKSGFRAASRKGADVK